MNLNQFYDGNSDAELLKSLEGNEQVNQEELSKAMNRAGLVQKQITVHSKNGDYQAMKWVKASDDKKLQNTRPQKHEEQKTHNNHHKHKGFEVIGKGFLYMEPGNNNYLTLEEVVNKYNNADNRKNYKTLNSFIKSNFFVSDGNSNTVDFYKVNGEYTEQRIKDVHDVIIQKIIDKCPVPPKGEKPICFLYGGGSASGKSTVVNKVVTPLKEELGYDFGKVDADSIKEQLPEHNMFVKQDIDLAAAREHRESADITNKAISRLIDEGRTFAYDGTMSNFSKYADIIKRLNDKGYEVRIVAVDIPVNEALKRAALRERKIPDSIVKETHAAFSKNFIRIINECDVDSVCLYDNSQPEGEEPTMILDSETDDFIGNQELYERFLKKGGYNVKDFN